MTRRSFLHFAFYGLVVVLLALLLLKILPLLLWPGAALVSKSVGENGTRPPIWLVCLNALWSFYVLFAFSAVAATVTALFASSPDVEHRWLYYILGFFGCYLPLQYIANEETIISGRGSSLGFAGVALTPLAYIVFSLWHGLMKPWAWIPWVKLS
jgi:hypothetical protein